MKNKLVIDPHTLSGEKETWTLQFKHVIQSKPDMDRTESNNIQRIGIMLDAFIKGDTPSMDENIFIGTASFIPGHKPDIINLTTYPMSEDFVEALLNEGLAKRMGRTIERYQDYPGADEVEEFLYQHLDITDFYNQYIKDRQKMAENSPVSHITLCQGPVVNGKNPQDYIKCRIGGIEFIQPRWVGTQGRELFKVADYYPDARFHLYEMAEEAFAKELELYRQAQQRVTHYTCYEMKGNYYIRCKIDGEQQLARNINKLDVYDYLEDKNFYALAAKYYADKLENGTDMKRGLSL